MKYLIVIFFLFTGFSSFAQQSQGNDTSKYVWYKFQYGSKMDRYEAIKVLVGPKDTTFSKSGYAVKGTNFYIGNGIYWTLVNSSTQTNYNSIDSATTTGNEVCLWSLGVPFICFTINSTPGDTTIAGLDSVIVQGNLLCQWKAGVSTCYTISNTIINNTNNYITNVYTGVDSVVVSGTNLCQWSGGIATCYTISTAPGDTTISGIDSVTIQGSQLCQWKAGVSTCYTVTNTINNSSFITYVDSSIMNVYNYMDSSTVIINSGSGLDSIRINGYQICFYLHDSASPRCWQLNTFFDDVRLSDDSTLYEFYNGDSLVKTVPSGIKNVGAVWPLSYNGVDLTTSKPFNDSLYLSSLVKHSDSLFSKKLTGDSVFVGLMSGSGGSSSGIDSMYVTSDSLYIVFIYSPSGRRDSVGYSGSSGTGGGTGTVTSVATGYGLSGGTITSTGTIIADSAALSLKYIRRADSVGNTGYSQLWRLNKVRDSLQTNIDTKLTGTLSATRILIANGVSSAYTDTSFRYSPTASLVSTKNYAALVVRPTPTAVANTDTIVGMNIRTTYDVSGKTGVIKQVFKINGAYLNIDSLYNFSFGTGSAAQTTGNSNFIGQLAGGAASSAANSNFFGYSAGVSATSASNSNFFGNTAGGSASSAANSNFFGNIAGQTATNASSSNFFGTGAGSSATNANNSNFFGTFAGTSGTGADNSNFFGQKAGGLATSAANSNFFGPLAGLAATGASYSNFFGYHVGDSLTHKITGSNNILIGTNITTPTAASANMASFGNVLYLFNTYSTNTGNPATAAQTTGQVGININAPATSAVLDITSTTAGVLIPRMTTTQKNAISSPAEGLEVYDLTLHQKSYYNGTTWINY